MLRQFTVIAALVATALSVGDAAHYNLKVVQAATASDATTADSTATVKANTWHMKPVTSVQARVQGDAPVYDATAKIWVSSRGKTLEEQYRSVLDTVNTASVEGALMYVQAETINVKEQSVECERKNKVQNVVFYELTILQPTYALAAYPTSSTPEYTPYLAMDGGKCTNEKDSLPKACKQLYGLDGELALGASVGAESKKSDPRAPYPGNYWFSFPNSCADQPWANKTDECRKTHAGGLCPVGTQPDGDTCSFAYKILGYIKIDDLVGITALDTKAGDKKYASYAEFCKDGGIEFSATNTASTGFTDVKSLPFWEKPGDETANAERAAKMVKMYNELAPKATATGGPMVALPTVADLVARNPKCYENVEACATAKNGCRRTLLAQLCEVCMTAGDGCEVAPTDFKFPTLVSATLAPTVAPTANSTTEPGTSGSPTPTPASSGAAGAARAFATSFASVAVAVGVAAVALL